MMVENISADRLREQKNDFVIIDVREPDEIPNRSIEGSINIPLGLAIPFIICAVAIDRVMFILKRLQKHLNLIEKISGGLLIGVGVLLLSGSFSVLNSAFSKDITSNIIQNDL